MPPSFTLCVPRRPLFQIMPCRSVGLASTFSGLALFLYAFVCRSGPISRKQLPPDLPFSFVCFFSFCLSLQAQYAFLVCSLCFWPPFCICFFLFSCSVPSPLSPSPLIFFTPSPLFICCPVYSLPLSSLLSFLSFCLLCFLIFFYLSCLHGGLTEAQTHMGANTYCM